MRKFVSGCINLDSSLFLRIYHLSGKRFVDVFFYLISRMGDGWLYALLAAAYLIFRTEKALSIMPALVSGYALESLVYFLIKKNVKRIRPFNTIDGISRLITPPDEFSFPSGHTAAAAVIAVVAGSAIPQVKPVLFTYLGLIGFSRVYNGVHYPGDVFAGAVLGIICGKIAVIIF